MLATFLLPTLLLSTPLASDAPMLIEDPAYLDERVTKGLLDVGRGAETETRVSGYWYDLEEKLGRKGFFVSPSTHVRTTLFPFGEEPSSFGAGFISVSEQPVGSPLYAEFDLDYGVPQSAFNARYSIYSAVGASYSTGYWQQYLFPVQGSRTGIDGLSYINNPICGAVMVVDYFISEDRNSPSLLIPGSGIPDVDNKKISVLVEYLEGNHLESVGSEFYQFDMGRPYFPDASFGAVWCDGPVFPGTIRFTNETPVGPMRLSVALEGYTTDTINLDVVEGREYHWNAVMQPISGPGPLDIGAVNLPLPPPRNVLTLALERAITADFVPIVYLDEPTNPNGDGLRDVADLVRLGVE